MSALFAPAALAPAAAEGAATRSEIAMLALILAVAVALRLPGLADPLWFDEIMTLVTHVRLPWSEMMRDYSMNHHYLYSFEAKAAVDLLGEGPVALRLPALLFGIGSVAAGWWVARMVGGWFAGLLTAALLATSYHHIWFSQNARGYTELALWCTLGAGLFLKGVRAPTPGTWVWFAVTLVLSILTHLTGAFFYFALGLVWLWLLVRRGTSVPGLVVWPLAAFVGGLAVSLLFFVPLLPSLVETVGGVAETSAEATVTDYTNPFWTVAEALRTALGGAGPILLAAGLLIVGLAFVGARAGGPDGRLVGLMVLVHIVATMALLKLIGMRIWPRFFFNDIGLLLLLLVLGMQSIALWLGENLGGPRLGRAFVWLGAAGMVAVSLTLAVRNYAAPKQDLEGAIAVVETAPRPGERTYAVGYAGEAYEVYYQPGWERIMSDAGLEAALAEPGPVTLVIGFPGRTLEEVPSIRRGLDDGSLQEVALLPGTLGDGAVLILRR